MSISIPDADYTPQLVGYTGQGAFRFWCQKVLPIVYDDSLSYYELLNKVVVYLNNVISDVSQVETNVGLLNDSFNDLQTFVNTSFQDVVREVNGFEDLVNAEIATLHNYLEHYFENLDVQQEINNKLDQMAADGSLDTLIYPLVSAAAPDIIEQWMNDNITPTTPVIDSSLSIEGAAADAKATGDGLNTCVRYRPNVTEYTDVNTLIENGTYFKEAGVNAINGLNSNGAKIVVFGSHTGYGIVQLWFDLINRTLSFRIKRTPTTNWTAFKQIYTERDMLYHISGVTEPGSIGVVSGNGGYLNNASTYRYTRSEKMYEIEGGSDIKIEVYPVPEDITGNSIGIYYYNGNGEFLSSSIAPAASEVTRTTPALAKYVKINVSDTGSTSFRDETFILSSNKPIYEKYNLNKNNLTIGDSLAFVYKVTGDEVCSGRLLLPPNYKVDGKKVPLIVYIHGSNCLVEWDGKMGELVRWDNDTNSVVPTGDSYLPYLQYLANEGFAVFDCYPYPKPLLTPAYVDSPFCVPPCINAYLMGIKYVCSRFNVDINKVNVLCKSQGGQLGQWAVTQTLFPFKSVSLFAPACGIGTTNSASFLVSRNCRSTLRRIVAFDGSNDEIEAFVEYGKVDDTANGLLVASFIEKNKGILTSMCPAGQRVTNSDFETIFYGCTHARVSVPDWMLEEGLPPKPEGASNLYSISADKTLIKNSNIPSKFWAAFDDAEVPAYSVYACYYWLKNGASDTAFRELPIGTGGHHAMDTSPTAVRTSGTTKLGIEYSNIPVAYVEVVDFIRDKAGY